MRRLLVLLLASALMPGPARAANDSPGADVAGASDHPLLRRFDGSLLIGYAQDDWAARSLPGPAGLARKGGDRFEDPLQLEGRVTRLFYLHPLGKSPLEVFRNHQQALLAAGLKPAYQCEPQGGKDCARAYFALDKNERGRGMAWAKGYLNGATADRENSRWSLQMAISYKEGRLLSGSLNRGGQPVQMLLYTSEAANEHTRRAASYLEIIEPKPMQTGQVAVDAAALGQGLQSEGRVALYGVLFDSGKTALKPESEAQLEQMAALLKAQPALKVFIVGHTDNVGALDANLALSQGRAQAVVAALGQRGIAASRLQARGVANLAPLASNADEAGRARNRRVELVLQ